MHTLLDYYCFLEAWPQVSLDKFAEPFVDSARVSARLYTAVRREAEVQNGGQ